MKDILFRVRCWIGWYAMPKDVRPIFIKALRLFAEELLKELKETVDTNQDEGEEKDDLLQHVREGEEDA